MRPSLYDAVGGGAAVLALAQAHHARCLADAELNHPFTHADLRMHAGNADMGDLGRRFVACFVAAADDAGLPADPELRAALRAYMVWAVDDVLSFAEPEDVPDGRPMPRWSWDGLVRG